MFFLKPCFFPLGGKLLNSSKYILSEHNINEYALRMNLTINRLKKSDFGEYACSAVNAYGRAEGVVILKGMFQYLCFKYI